VAAAVLALTVSACGSGGSSTSGGGDVDSDGVLNVAYTLPAMPLDPHKPTSDIAQFTYAAPVYDRLTKAAPGPEIVPMLADSWEFAADGMSVTFKLHKGVTFSDGTDLDADAVKKSLDRAISSPDSTVGYRFSMVKEVKVVDPLTVQFVTNRKAADLPAVLAGTAASIISPKALDNPDLDVKPVGSGPYTVTKLTLGESATYERRDDYWGPEKGLPKTITITGIPDENARLNALRSGQVDLAPVNITNSEQAKGLPSNFNLETYPPSATWALFLNTTTKVMANVKVRQALNYAIDRDTINKTLLKGNCTPGAQPLAPGAQGFLEDPPIKYDYDPEKAKQLLAEAGYPDGFTADLLFSQGLSVHEALGTAIQGQLADIGVDLKIVKKDPTQAPALYASEGFETYMQTRVAAATSTLNLAGNYSPPRFPGPVPQAFTDALAIANDPALPADKVEAALKDASAIANEQAFDLFVCSYPTLVAHSNTVANADKMGVSFYTGTLDVRALSVLSK
jgi:ABC-type transport system substrate-binding protein